MEDGRGTSIPPVTQALRVTVVNLGDKIRECEARVIPCIDTSDDSAKYLPKTPNCTYLLPSRASKNIDKDIRVKKQLLLRFILLMRDGATSILVRTRAR